MDVVNTPTSLTFKSEHDTYGSCYSAFYKEDGDLLLGCSGGVGHVRHRDKKITKYDTGQWRVSSVVEHHRNVFILHQTRHTCFVEICLPGVTQREKLFEFQSTSIDPTSLTVSEKYVVVINPETKTLLLYDFLTKQTVTLTPTVNPTDVYFLPDGDLLVLGLSDDSIFRYKIENNQLTLVWTYTDISIFGRGGICTDHNGLIYACSTGFGQTIVILSPEGIIYLLQTMH